MFWRVGHAVPALANINNPVEETDITDLSIGRRRVVPTHLELSRTNLPLWSSIEHMVYI